MVRFPWVLAVSIAHVFDAAFSCPDVEKFSRGTVLVLFRWLVVSLHREIMFMLCELLNNADFYLCYVIKSVLANISSVSPSSLL